MFKNPVLFLLDASAVVMREITRAHVKRQLLAAHFPWGALDFGLCEFAQTSVYCSTAQTPGA